MIIIFQKERFQGISNAFERSKTTILVAQRGYVSFDNMT